jgi:hypothetical protein
MLPVTVVLGVVAFSASLAWANEGLPAWGQCVHTESGTGGKYADAGCTQPVKKVYRSYTGGYEWYPHEVSPEVGVGEGALQDRIPAEEQPVSSTTITLADGGTITCQALRETTVVDITGPHTTLGAPRLAFRGCRPSEGSECHSTDAEEEAEITTIQAWEDYFHRSGPTWHGTLTYFKGRRTSDPVVGYVWQTSPPKERFLQQIVCEGGPVQALLVGGHKRGEELATEITPVNTMSRSHTLTMSQSDGVGLPSSFEGRRAKPLEALVNGETWEPIGFDATMLFPETEGVASLTEPEAVVVQGEMELKATP